ncbi:uncharacterized protein C3orf38 homolog [Exaiptasia diaphana]|uniref:Uncharacterized protein n=1 Tax=Exaiptasia diaphana TaxID=2652724 RepID=A0A913Y924_EXADI|nr:uncharacterized protein C3orf38 homolog [Exaiptasia diaphana]KXJ28857.1 Uncharacterized protein C3orf38-like [Exaiptasia diaphana]
MLTEKEKEFARELLERIELRDLITLTDTVTNRAVSTENRKEATDAILLYSVNAAQLLRRKKVKRDHLYQYLAEKGHVESVAADKAHLCRRVLKLWGNTDEFDKDDDDDYGDFNDSPEVDPPKTKPVASNPGNKGAITAVDGQALAQHFIPWFYSILNSLPGHGHNADDQWGDHHFWSDAKCNIIMLSEQHVQEECQGSEAVSTKLAQVVSNEKLFFNVNTPSIKGDINSYGLVRILAGGTVHRFDTCLGIFEQTFGLIRDPHADNNWKIKFTNLRLKSQSQLQGNERQSLGAPDAGPLSLKH